MFETYDYARVFLPQVLRKPGQHIWWSIQMQLCISWFHVTYEEIDIEEGEEITFRTITFLSSVTALIDFSNLPDYKIVEIYLVSPSYLNGTKNWKMERLKEIWEAEVSEPAGQRVFIFIIEGNKKYIESHMNTTEERLINNRKIFSVNN